MPVAAPEVTNTARPASERFSSGSSVRISRQLADRLMSITCVPGILRHVVQRRQRTEDAGVADEDVELAPALEQRRPELIDLVALAEIELQQRRLAAARADLVVELLERADGARGDDDVGAVLGEGERDGPADAARGAGDEREPVFERFLVFHDHA